MNIDLPRIHFALLRIDCGNDALRAEVSRRFRDQRRIFDARRVDAHFVGAGIEQRADIVDRIDAASDGQRDENLIGHRLDHVVEKPAIFDAGADVQERDLVSSLLVIAPRNFDRVAGITQVDEIHALDDASLGDVEARDDALGEAHQPPLAALSAALKSSLPS